MATVFTGVVYRRWKSQPYGGMQLVQTMQSKKLVALAGKGIKAGKPVELATRIVDTSEPGSRLRNGTPYDVIDLTIGD